MQQLQQVLVGLFCMGMREIVKWDWNLAATLSPSQDLHETEGISFYTVLRWSFMQEKFQVFSSSIIETGTFPINCSTGMGAVESSLAD